MPTRGAFPFLGTERPLRRSSGGLCLAGNESAARPISRRLRPGADVDEAAGDRRGRGHHRRHEVRPTAEALTALEVAVRRGGAALARLEAVLVHGEAHRATRLAPFEARGGEYPVE